MSNFWLDRKNEVSEVEDLQRQLFEKQVDHEDQIERLQAEYNTALEAGFEEAYQEIVSMRKRHELELKEVHQIISDLQELIQFYQMTCKLLEIS